MEESRVDISEENMDNRRPLSSWFTMLLTLQPLSHKSTHKKRLDPGGPSQDDSLTPLLSSTMSGNDKYTNSVQGVVVSVADLEESSTSTRSIDEGTRQPWWSYIWVSFFHPSYIVSIS
jgi:hypothetical protein